MTGSFVFDANRCTGCGACRVACTIENGLAPDVSWRRIETFNPQRSPVGPVFHLSIACNHCATAACMDACPALAYRRDDGSGAVLLDSKPCIGCGYCAWACPYDAPVFDESAGVMTKCTWCADRLRAGLKPACVSHCPTGALDYSAAPIPAGSPAIEGLPVTSLVPRLHVIPLATGRMQPEMTAPSPDFSCTEGSTAAGSSTIGLRREWPLAVFTLGAALLVGSFTAAVIGARRLDPWVFAMLASTIMGTANVHLGRKERAWRAVLNVRRSWLSREVALLSLFVTLAATWLFAAPGGRTPGALIAVLGFAGLYSADRLYGVLPGGSAFRHSAGVTYTGLLMAASFAGEPRFAAFMVGMKLSWYVRRQWRAGTGAVRLPLLFARTLAGAAGVLLLPTAYWPALLLILIGEVIDRGEYYVGLARQTPRAEMDRALVRRVAVDRGGAGLAPACAP